VILRAIVTLGRSHPGIFGRLGSVSLRAIAGLERHPKCVLGLRAALVSRLAEEPHGLSSVPTDILAK
jgi:hypothetical protein